MDKQLSRIESFVTNLVNNEFTNGQMAMVLSADCDVVGGDNGTCTNEGGAMPCGDTNRTCGNSGPCGTKNGTCENKPPKGFKPLDPNL